MIKAIAMIRKLDKTEYDRATSLALEVYIQCGAEDFDEEGLNSFKSFIFSEQPVSYTHLTLPTTSRV